MSGERFIIRTVGGPYPGDRMSNGPWPLPDELPVPGEPGTYIKVSQSVLEEPHPGVLRGAEYHWITGEARDAKYN